jgi:hypothetical protein
MTLVTAAIPAAASGQPCATHWRRASAIGSRGDEGVRLTGISSNGSALGMPCAMISR